MTKLIYPVIFTYEDDAFDVSSPNIKGMHTFGKTMAEAAQYAEDAIATMIEGSKYPEPEDASKWKLKKNQEIVYISVDMPKWLAEKNSKTVQRTVTVPEYLNDLAKERGINVSGVLTKALEEQLC